jgi:hypothetical protein
MTRKGRWCCVPLGAWRARLPTKTSKVTRVKLINSLPREAAGPGLGRQCGMNALQIVRGKTDSSEPEDVMKPNRRFNAPSASARRSSRYRRPCSSMGSTRCFCTEGGNYGSTQSTHTGPRGERLLSCLGDAAWIIFRRKEQLFVADRRALVCLRSSQ